MVNSLFLKQILLASVTLTCVIITFLVRELMLASWLQLGLASYIVQIHVNYVNDILSDG